MSEIKFKMIAVTSKDLAEIGYDLETKTLRINFLSGGQYDYANVEPILYRALENAGSKGQFFHAHIKPHHTFTRRK